jgi:hypothetical protein
MNDKFFAWDPRWARPGVGGGAFRSHPPILRVIVELKEAKRCHTAAH